MKALPKEYTVSDWAWGRLMELVRQHWKDEYRSEMEAIPGDDREIAMAMAVVFPNASSYLESRIKVLNDITVREALGSEVGRKFVKWFVIHHPDGREFYPGQ